MNVCISPNMISYVICLPSEIALTNIVKARIKMIKDARPNKIISLRTICCPTMAARVATRTR